MQTLTVLILASAAASYHKAQEAAHAEANTVDHLVEVAAFLPDAAQRHRAQADVVCCTRTVRHFEWPAMSHGEDSAVPSVWTGDLRKGLKDIGPGQGAFGLLVVADDSRAKTRPARLTGSTAAVPPAVYWFMLVLLSITLISLCIPRCHNQHQLATLAVRPPCSPPPCDSSTTPNGPTAESPRSAPPPPTDVEQEQSDAQARLREQCQDAGRERGAVAGLADADDDVGAGGRQGVQVGEEFDLVAVVVEYICLAGVAAAGALGR